jgi:hypothetical protein
LRNILKPKAKTFFMTSSCLLTTNSMCALGVGIVSHRFAYEYNEKLGTQKWGSGRVNYVLDVPLLLSTHRAADRGTVLAIRNS